MAKSSTIPASTSLDTGGSSSSPKPRPLQKVYDYLRSQNKIRENTLEEFEQNMADPAKLERVFTYLRGQNKIKSQSFEEFQRVMSPPAATTPPPPVPGSDFLSQNIAQTAQAIAERGVPEVQQAQDVNQLEQALSQVADNMLPQAEGMPFVPSRPPNFPGQPGYDDAQFQQALEGQQHQRASDFIDAVQEGRYAGPGMHDPVTADQAAGTALGNFNRPFIDLLAAMPKTAGMVVNEAERLLAGIQGKEKPSIEDNKLYSAGQWLQDKALEVGITATDPRLQDSFFFTDVPAAGGSALAIIMSQGRSGFARPAQLTQSVTRAPLSAGAKKAAENLSKALSSRGAAAGGLMMGSAEYDAAIQAGASEEEAMGVFLKNYLVGQTESIPLERALARLNRLTGNKIIDVIKAGTVGSIEEATQEAVQTYLTNKIADGSYDPGRDSFVDVLRSAGAGAFVGFFLPGIGVAMQRMSPDQREETRAQLNQAFKEINPEKAAQVEQDIAAAQSEGTADTPAQAEPAESAAAPIPEVSQPDVSPEIQVEAQQEGDGPETATQATSALPPASELDASWRQAHQANEAQSLREWLFTNAQVGDEISYGDGDFVYEVTMAGDGVVILRPRDLDPETGQFTESTSIVLRRGESDAQEKGFAKVQGRDLKVLLGGTPEYVRPQQFRNEMEAISDPVDLARMYVHEVRDLTGVDPRNLAIAEAIDNAGGISRRSVKRFGDVNVVGRNLAKAYIREDGQDIDQIAMDASMTLNPEGDGTDIAPDDVWEFMLSHWDTGSISTPKGNPRLAQIADRYKELTGKKINIRIAKLIVGKQQADAQVESIPEESLQPIYNDDQLMDALKIIDAEGITPERLKNDKKLLSLFNDVFPYRKEDLERIRFIFDYANTPEGSQKIAQLVPDQVQRLGEGTGSGPGLPGVGEATSQTGVAEPEPTPVSDAVQEPGADAVPVQESPGDSPAVEEGASRSEPQETPVQSTSDQSPASAEDIKAAQPESKSDILSETRSGKRAGVIGAPNSAMQYDANLFMGVLEQSGKIFTKYFTSKGYLPQEVFDLWIRTKGEIAKYEAQIRFTLRDIKAAIAKEYVDAKGRSRKLTDGEIIDLNLALQGKQPQGTIPERTAALIRDMRDQVDNLSRRFIAEGVVAGDLAATFTDHLGMYLTRSFRKHDDPFWAEFVPPEARNKAEGFIRNNAQYRAQEYFAKAAKLRDRHMKKDDLIKRLQERIKEARQPFQAKISDKTTPQQVRDVIEREMQAVVELRQKIDRLEKRDYKKIARQNKKKADKLMKEGKEMEAQEFLTRHTKALERDKTKPQRLKRMRDRLKELEKPFEARIRERMTPDQVREIIDNAFDTIQKLQTEIDKLQERDFLLEAGQLEAQGHELMRMTDEEVQGMINFLLYDKNAPMAIMKGSKLGSKDLSILKRRKDIAPEIRALMGEYSDPLLNYARTITKMANLIAKHHFLIDVRAQGMGKFLFEKPTGKYAVQIAAKGSKTMGPLNGLYTTKEIAEAFEEFNSTEPNTTFFKLWIRVNGYIKAGKTVGSLMTHVRNFVGNIGFVVMNGHWRLNKFGKAAQVAWANIYSSDEVIKEKFKEYVELRVIGDGGQSGELRQYLEDIRNGKDFFETINESRMKKFGRQVLEGAQLLYQFEDDVFKIFAFENEYARYKKAFPNWTDEQLKQKCATIVRNTYPTYSLTPRAVKMLRLNPLVGSFPSFPAEVIRTTYNTVALAREELANPATRSIGAVRAAGILAAFTIPTMASIATRAFLGLGGDDDEDLRVFVAPWQKNSEFLYTKREGAKIRLIDMGYTDPHSYLKRPVYDLFQSPEEEVVRSIGDAAWSLMEPFLGEEILTERLIDFTRNRKANNDHVYNPNAPLGDIAQDVFMHFYGGAEIGTISSLRRIYKALNDKTSEHGNDYEVRNEVMGLMMGVKEETKDIGQSLVFRAYDIRNAAEIAKRDLQQVKKNKAATPEEIASAQREYDASIKRITEMGLKAYSAAIRLGVDPKEARRTMIKARVPELVLAIAEQRRQERAQQSDKE